MHKIKWQQRRKKKKVSKKLKRFLMKNKLDSIYKALVYSDSSNNYFDFSNSTEGKIGYLKGSRIPSHSHLLFNKEYRTRMGYHATVGKLVSSSEHTDNYQVQRASALLYVESKLKDNEMFLTSKISHYYYKGNYSPMINGSGGSLYGSCMRESWCSDAIKLYEKFGSNVVQLLVLLDDNGLVMGRALFWKAVRTRKDVEEYLDRVYALNNNVAQAFYSWADRRGCKSYNQQSIYGHVDVSIDEDDSVPYFDTFTSYSHYHGLDTCSGDYCLQETSCETLGNTGGQVCDNCGCRYDSQNEGAYTRDTNEYVCEECHRYCADGECYAIDNTVYVGRDWYHEDDENIVFSTYDDKWYHIDNTVYSEHLDSSIHIADSVEDVDGDFYHIDNIDDVIYEINGSYYHCDSEEIVQIDDTWYVKDDIVLSHEGNWFVYDSDEILEFEDEHYEIAGDKVISADDGEYYHIEDDDIVCIDDNYYRKDSPKIYLDEGDCEFKLRQYQFC